MVGKWSAEKHLSQSKLILNQRKKKEVSHCLVCLFILRSLLMPSSSNTANINKNHLINFKEMKKH